MTDLDAKEVTKLLLRVKEHSDVQAFTILFKWFTPKIRTFGLKHFYQEAKSMDLVQETMTLVWRKSHLFNPEKGAGTTWIYTIMRNHCFDMLRKQQSNREDCLSDELWPLYEEQEPPETDEGEALIINRELIARLQQLPQAQQDVVRGIYLNDMSHQQLADTMGIPLGTIKSRLRLGLAKLKDQYDCESDHD